MINEVPINKDQSENDDKSKKYDSLIRAYNEKGFFPFILEPPTQNFSTKISSPSKKLVNKPKFEFSSLKKDFSANNWNYAAFSGAKLPDFVYGYQNTLLESSGRKNFIEFENNNKKEISLSGQKKIKQKLNNEFEGILLTKKRDKEKVKDKEKEESVDCSNKIIDKKKEKKSFSITLTVNDSFFELLYNIYTNEGIELEQEKEKDNKNENIIDNNIKDVNNILKDNISQNNNIINNNNINNNKIHDNNNNITNEQISCICLKSQCLNNYCSCHKNGNACNKNCRCISCKNDDKYINNKIKKNDKNKSKCKCTCQNSNCVSLYCDCKKRGILCTRLCSCLNCKNSKTES